MAQLDPVLQGLSRAAVKLAAGVTVSSAGLTVKGSPSQLPCSCGQSSVLCGLWPEAALGSLPHGPPPAAASFLEVCKPRTQRLS